MYGSGMALQLDFAIRVTNLTSDVVASMLLWDVYSLQTRECTCLWNDDPDEGSCLLAAPPATASRGHEMCDKTPSSSYLARSRHMKSSSLSI